MAAGLQPVHRGGHARIAIAHARAHITTTVYVTPGTGAVPAATTDNKPKIANVVQVAHRGLYIRNIAAVNGLTVYNLK